MMAGESFAYLKPHLRIILTDYWMPMAWYGGLALVTLMAALYSAARALGLAGTSWPRNWNRRTGGNFPEPEAQQPQQTRKGNMNTKNLIIWKHGALLVSVLVLSAGELLAQGTSPWLQAIDVLQQAFTGPIARGLSLIAIVVGGLMFAFGEGGLAVSELEAERRNLRLDGEPVILYSLLSPPGAARAPAPRCGRR